ncbi:MAG TPA: hypothetical protein VGH36_12415 [Acetobacteraceae bacterium]|jgi:hypothetical protein
MTGTARLVLALAAVALAACTGLNLEPPITHHEFPKETGPIITPPPGLINGTSQ